MSAYPASSEHPAPLPAWTALLLRKELWGGVTLVTVWLGVLFVGVFGGNIQTSEAGGGGSSIPVVVVVAIVALIATVSIGRWAFGGGRES